METENINQRNESKAPSIASLKWSLRFLFKVVLPIVCVVGAILFAVFLIKTGPKAERKKPQQQARQVTVKTLTREDLMTTVNATGTVIAARQITVNPEVSGRITTMQPEVVPGGLIRKGQDLIRIDRRDYDAIVKQKESDLARAQLALKQEYGNQIVAAQEYEMLAEIIDETETELVLRKPHLKDAKAALTASVAALEKARLDVRRCVVTAPFNAIIQEKFVDVGARVSPTSPLLSIIGTDEFWIELKVSVDQLKWITVPDNNETKGSKVKIYNPSVWGPDVYRQGAVIRLLGQLEEKGRRAQLLVSVKDPLCLDARLDSQPRLLIDSYVSAEIEGKKLDSVIIVKRNYLHDGDNVWVMNDQNRLEIRPVKIIFRDPDVVYIIEGICQDENVITSDISAPVNGMLLRLEGQLASPMPFDSADDKKGREDQ